MNHLNWKEFEFIDHNINHKNGEKYYQQYLKPCWYIDLNFRWTNEVELIQLYDEVIQKLGHHFVYHCSNNQSSESKFRNKQKAFSMFRDFWDSKETYLWRTLSNVGGIGVGKNEAYGGVGDASFSCWIHKAVRTKELNNIQVQQYISNLKKHNTACLGRGVTISNIQICLPLNDFESPNGFFNWVCKIVKPLELFSGTAGLRMNHWQGYGNNEAQNKLNTILDEYPGFDLDWSTGNTLGTVLNKDKTRFLPLIKRINWLNIIENTAVEELGGIENIKAKNITEIANINHGIIMKTTPNPVLKKDNPQLKKYSELNAFLQPILYANRYTGYNNQGVKIKSEYLNWLHTWR